MKVLESYSYFSMSLIYVVFLTDTFGVGDVAAGGSYGLWGMLTVAWGVLLGPVIDSLGTTALLALCPRTRDTRLGFVSLKSRSPAMCRLSCHTQLLLYKQQVQAASMLASVA